MVTEIEAPPFATVSGGQRLQVLDFNRLKEKEKRRSSMAAGPAVDHNSGDGSI